MKIQFAEMTDLSELNTWDQHISKDELKNSIALQRVLLLKKENQIIAWLRWNLFWDNTPFMNLLFVRENYRHQGWGTKLIKTWEQIVKEQGYPSVMTSTLSNEQAQHLYRKLGYQDRGALFLPKEATEIIFYKNL